MTFIKGFKILLYSSLLILIRWNAHGQNCSVNAGLDQNICANEPVVLQGGAAGKIDGLPMWTLESGPSVVIENPNQEVTNVLGTTPGETYVFKFSALCEDGNRVSQSITVVIQPITVAKIEPFTNTCPGTYPLVANAPGPNETGEWSFANDENNGLVIADLSSPSTTITLPEGEAKTTNVIWTITNSNGCKSKDDSFDLFNEGTVSPVSAGADRTLSNCYTVTRSVKLDGSYAGNGTGTWSFVSGPTIPNIEKPHVDTTYVSKLSAGVYVFRWSVNSTCVNDSDEVTITVPPGTQNVTNASVNQRNYYFCTPVTQLTLKGNPPRFTGERVLWTQLSGPAGVVFNPDDTPTTLVTGLNGSSTYKFRYQIINDATGCVSNSRDITVRYYLTPATIDLNSPVIEGNCGDLEVDIPFNYSGGNRTEWRIISGPYTTNFKKVSGKNLNYTFEQSGVYRLLFARETVTNGLVISCNTAFDNVTVTVANEPTLSNAGTDQVLACSVNETELVANVPDEGTGTWTLVSGPSSVVFDNVNDPKTKISGLIPGVYQVRWLISSQLICSDNQGDIQITVSDPNIQVDAGKDQNICTNSELQLDANSPQPGQSGKWSVSPQTSSLVFSNDTDPKAKVQGLDASTDYTFTWEISNECGSSKDKIFVRVDDKDGPTPADAGPDQCLEEAGGSAITGIQLQANEITKGRGKWGQVSGPSTLNFSDLRAPDALASNAVQGQYVLTWTARELLFNCQISVDTVRVSIFPEFVPDAGADITICGDSFQMAAAQPASGVIGKWVQIAGNAGWVVDDINSPTATFSNVLPGQYVFDWELSGGNACTTKTDEVKVVLGEPVTVADAGPDRTQANGGTALCGLTTYTMQANLPTTGSGAWSVIRGPNKPTLSDPTASDMRITNLITGEYVFRWSISSGNICPPSTDDVVLQVSAPVDAGNDVELCDEVDYTLIANQGAIGTWTKTQGPGADPIKTSDNSAIASLIPGNTYRFKFTSDPLYGCSALEDEIEIVVKSKFTDIPNAGSDQSVCTDNPALQIFLSGSTPTTANVEGTWSIEQGPDGHQTTFSDVNDPNSELLNFIAGVYVLEWTYDLNVPNNLSCSVPLSDVVKIFIYDPGLANAGPDKTECLFNSSFDLAAVSPNSGIGTWTLIGYDGGAIPAGISILSPNLNTSTVTGIAQEGTYTFKWTVTSGAGVCPPSEDEVKIFFPPATVAPDAGPDQSLCPARGVSSSTVMDGNQVDSGEWRFIRGPNTPTIDDPTNPRTAVTNLQVGTYELAWFSLAQETSCDRSDNVLIVVNPVLSLANAGPDLTFPSSQNIILQATQPASGTGEWNQVSGPSTLTFLDKNDPNSAVIGAVQGTYILQWAVSGGNVCGNSTDRMELVVIGTADLSLTKAVNDIRPNIGDEVIFTIKLKNDGPDTATGVTVTDLLPFGFELEGATESPAVAANALSWKGISITSGQEITYEVRAKVRVYSGLNAYKNTAGVSKSDQFDPDSTPGNDDGDQSEDDEDSATVTPLIADLSLALSTSKQNPKVGGSVQISVTLSNDGPDNANGVGVSLLVPQGLEIGAINNGGALTGTKVITWSNLSLNKNGQLSLSFEANVKAPLGLDNEYKVFSEVVASNQFDPDSSPNNDLGIQAEDDEDVIELSPQSADLQIEYSASISRGVSPNVNDLIDFYIDVSNNGPNNASKVALNSIIDSNYAVIPGTITNGGNLVNDEITWTNLNINKNQSQRLTFRARVTDPDFIGQKFQNTAQIIASDQFDPDSEPNNDAGAQIEDDEDHIEFSPQVADLSLNKEVSNIQPSVNENVFFTLSLLNEGPNTATTIEVKDLLPNGFVYIDDDGGGSYDPATGLWLVSSLQKGQTAVLDIEAKVSQFGRLTNTAEVVSVDQYDPDSSPGNGILIEDDEDEASITQAEVVDLELQMSVDQSSPNVGEDVVFTIVVTNQGPANATGVSVLDALPSGLAYVSATGDGSYNELTGGWLIGDLDNTDTKTLTLTTTVLPAGKYINTAQVLAQNQVDIDSHPGNNVISEDDQEVISLNPTATIDLELTKTVNNQSPNTCSIVQFTVKVENLGPSEASGIQVVDLLPTGYDFISYSSSTGAYNHFTGLWVLDNAIIAGESEFLIITAYVNATGVRKNVAEITRIDQVDSDLTNNIDDVEPTPEANIDLALEFTASSLVPFVNDLVDFTITIDNSGCSEATNVIVQRLISSGFDYVGHTVSNGSYDPATGSWSLPSIASGGLETLVITARVLNSGNYDAVIEVVAADQNDVDSTPNNDVKSEDDEKQLNIFPRDLIDLSLQAVVSNATPFVGDQVQFDINLTSAAGEYSNATGIVVEGLLPNGYQLLSASTNAGGYSTSTGAWNIADLPADSVVSLTLVTRVLANGNYDFGGEIIGVNEEDIDSAPANGDDTEDDIFLLVVSPSELADLELSSSFSTTTPTINSTVVLQVKIENKGPNDATNIIISETIPTGLSFQNYTATNGVYATGSNNWSIKKLPANQSATLLMTFQVVASNATDAYKHIAEIGSVDQEDPDSSPGNGQTTEDDYTSSELQPIFEADLSLEKTVDNIQHTVGDFVEFEVIVDNAGPAVAHNIQVEDNLPTGYTFISDDANGTYQGGIWSIDSIESGKSITLTIKAQVKASGDYRNYAEIIAVDEPDPDSTPNNGVLGEDDIDDATTTADGLIAISLDKSVNTTSPQIGDDVTFTILVENAGPSIATGVVVTDRVQSGFDYQSSSGDGSYDEVVGAWVIGDIASGSSKTLNIIATVLGSGSYTNVAEVTAHFEFDNNSSPNNNDPTEDDQDEVVLSPVKNTDLSLIKLVDKDTADVGELVNFELILTNLGPSEASNIEVSDPLPDGFDFVSFSTSSGVYNPEQGLWVLGENLSVNERASLIISANLKEGTNYENIATISSLSEIDNDASNNSASADVVPIPIADLSLFLGVSDANPNVLDQVTFELVINNAGPSTANSAEIKVSLPTGLSFISADPNAEYNAGTSIWSLPTISSGQSDTLQLSAQLEVLGPYVLYAEVVSVQEKDPDSTPNNQSGVEDDDVSLTISPSKLVDLSIDYTLSSSSPVVGDTVTITSVLKNDGPSDATDIIVSAFLGSGLTIVNSNVDQGVYDALRNAWTVDQLQANDSALFTIDAIIETTGKYELELEVLAQNEQDQDSEPRNNILSEDDQILIQFSPAEALDLVVSKTATTSVAVGQLIEFEISVENVGPSVAEQVTLSDVLNTGYQYLSYSATTGLYDPNTGIWSLLTRLDPSNKEFLRIIARVVSSTDADAYQNAVSITNYLPINADVDLSNNSDTVNIAPKELIDLDLSQAITNPFPNVGESVDFTLKLKNTGFSTATNIQVQDVIQSGLSISSVSPAVDFDTSTGLWSVPQLAAGAETDLVITALVNAQGTYKNEAEVTTADQQDTDSQPNNGDKSEDDYTSITLFPRDLVDVELSISASTTNPDMGSLIDITITVSNNGPSDASGLVITGKLPSGLQYQSSQLSDGTYNQSTGSWSFDDLVIGATATLEVTAEVIPDGVYLVGAELTDLDQRDSDSTPANNNSNEDDQVALQVNPLELFDLVVTKVASNNSPAVGRFVEFLITVENNGPSTARDVVVSDVLSSGFQFESFNATSGKFDVPTGQWSINSDLVTGANETLTLFAKVIEANDYTNTAEITSYGPANADTDLSNNIDVITLNPIEQIDLELIMSTSNFLPNAGDNIDITLNLSNKGSNEATNVAVDYPIPSGFSFVSSSSSFYNPSNGQWSISSLSKGTSIDLVVTLSVLSNGEFTNVAEVSQADQEDVDSTPGNGDSSEDDYASLPIFETDLIDASISMTVSNTSPLIGEEVIYTVEARNDGPSPASGLIWKSTHGAGLSFESANMTAGSYNGTTSAWNLGSLDVGATATLNLTFKVFSSGDYSHVVELISANQKDVDSSPANNNSSEDDYAEIIITPDESADLIVEKVVSEVNPVIDSVVEYIVKVTNNGPSTIHYIEITDVLPAGLDLEAVIPSQGDYNPVTGVWSINRDLRSGQSETLVLLTRVIESNQAGAYSNQAEITDYLPSGIDIDPSNNISQVVINPISLIDLELNASVSDVTPTVGEIIVYAISIENKGPSSASNVLVSAELPNGLNLINADPAAAYDVTTGQWTVADLGVNELKQLYLEAEVLPQGDYQVIFEVLSAIEPDSDSSPNNQNPAEDDQIEVDITPSAVIDLELVLNLDTNSPTVGGQLQATLSLTNQGPSTATQISVRNIYGSALVFNNATGTAGNITSNGLVWTIDQLDAGTSIELVTTLDVDNSGDYFIAGEVISTEERDIDSTPANSDLSEDDAVFVQLSAVVQALDLIVTKSVTQDQPIVGETIEFDIEIENKGPSVASGVIVSDQLLAGYEFVGYAATNGNYNERDGKWTVNSDLSVGQKETLKILARVVEVADPSLYNNEAYLLDYSPAGQDVDATNDTSAVSVSPIIQVDIEVVQQVDILVPNAGDQVEFSVLVINRGPSTATGVVVKDALPSGLSFVNATPAVDYDQATGTWQVGQLKPLETKELFITAEVLPTGDYNNISELTALDQNDVDSSPNNGDPLEDDIASITLFEQDLIDVSLTATISNLNPVVSDIVTDTIKVINAGPSTATGVIVSVSTGSGLLFRNANTSKGTYDDATKTWTIGSLAAGEEVELELQHQISNVGDYNSIIQVQNHNERDVDSSPGNNNSLEDDEAVVLLKPLRQLDLEISQVVSNAQPQIGEEIEFDIRLINRGPSIASFILVKDLLPAGYNFKSSSATAGVYEPVSGIWLLSTLLLPAQIEELKLTVVVEERGNSNDYLNVAEIINYLPLNNDIDLSNNISILSTTPIKEIDLELSHSFSDSQPVVGTTVVLDLSLVNNGPSTATGIEVSYQIPDGLTFVNSTTDFDPSSGIWTIATLSAAQTNNLEIELLVEPEGSYNNEAEVIKADQSDVDSTPNNGSEDDFTSELLDVQELVDLVLTSSVSNARPSTNEVITFTFTIVNNGPSDATNVVVGGLLGSGFTFVNADPDQGTVDPVIGAWAVGTVTVGAENAVQLRLQARVNPTGNYTIVAEVTAVDQPAVSTPNNSDPNELDITEITNIVPENYIDLSLSSEVEAINPLVGDKLLMKFTLLNESFNDATGVSVRVDLPDGYRLLGTSRVFDTNTSEWTVGTVAAQSDEELIIEVEILDLATSYLTTAEIVSADQEDEDSQVNNGDPSEDDYTQNVIDPEASIDLELTIIGRERPNVGETLDIAVEMLNTGVSTARNIAIDLTFGNGYIIDQFTSTSGDYDPATGRWTVLNLPSGGQTDLIISFNVTNVDDYLICAEIMEADGLDEDSTPGNGVFSEDDQDCFESFPIIAIEIPEGFSPNGDGINDVFAVRNLEVVYPNFRYEIFNRWGERIYVYVHNGDPTKTPDWWDGRSRANRTINSDNLSPSATYYYVIHYNDADREPTTGWVYVNY